jgi:hypothetical protein
MPAIILFAKSLAAFEVVVVKCIEKSLAFVLVLQIRRGG